MQISLSHPFTSYPFLPFFLMNGEKGYQPSQLFSHFLRNYASFGAFERLIVLHRDGFPQRHQSACTNEGDVPVRCSGHRVLRSRECTRIAAIAHPFSVAGSSFGFRVGFRDDVWRDSGLALRK
jgi:hypothetical protein